MPADSASGAAPPPAPRWPAAAAIVYVAAVLAIDTLAAERVQTPFDWTIFRWGARDVHGLSSGTLGLPEALTGWLRWRAFGSFDFFKFACWFLIPFACCVPRMDWAALGIARWRRIDYRLLIALGVLGIGAVAIIPFVPSLRAVYGSASGLPLGQKALAFGMGMMWVASWLPGWEFLHRYVLLRAGLRLAPRHGWLLVPLFEGLYHLQKPWLEMCGMVVFSLVLTWWAMRRRNLLLPFAAHLIIEIAVVLFMLLF